MASKILCAGFSKEEKGAVEAEVKPVMAARPSAESWTISLVKTGTRLAVTVDGPDDRIRGKNFVAELWELRQKLMDLLVNNGFPTDLPAAAPPARKDPPSSPSIPFRKDPPSSPSIPFRRDPPSSPSIPKPMASPPPAKPAPAPVVSKSMPAVAKTSAPPIKPAPARPAAVTAPPITPPPQQRVAAPLTPPPSRVVSTPPGTPHQLEEEYDWESPHAVGERRKAHQCEKCKRRFAVVYEALPNEPQMVVSVACPHCWEVDRMEIGENAALSRQYRADQLKD